jgi:hypothetical protein
VHVGTPATSLKAPIASATAPLPSARTPGALRPRGLKRPAPRSDGQGEPVAPRLTQNTKLTVNPCKLRADRLGTLVSALVSELQSAKSWEDFVLTFRGRSYLADDLDRVDHPAAGLLRHWRDHGVPAQTSSEPWSDAVKDSHVERGCHRSASEQASFLREEMAEFIDNKFWVVLPYQLVRHMPTLQLSPAAVKEERARKPRLLCDHSWYPVNEDTLPGAPPEAMQFGRALQRVLHAVRHADPAYGPVHMCKYDIKDGFYRMFLAASDCPRLAIILPRYEGEPQLVAIPMSCTMGWVESPPSFSAMSETIADLANSRMAASPNRAKPHRLEAHAAHSDRSPEDPLPEPRGEDDSTASLALATLYPLAPAERSRPDERAPPSNRPLLRPVQSTDVFVDDFIQLGQGSPRRLRTLRRHLLHSVDTVLARPLPGDNRNEAVSLKKLLGGDGSWGTRKLILGWIIDSARQTIELPPHRKQVLCDIFTELQGLRRISAKKWSSILGRLRFVSTAISGSAGLLSALQVAQNRTTDNRVRLSTFVHSNIDTFGRLAASLCSRPTHLAEIVPQLPTLLGATDAARAGMGGMYFDHTGQGYYWRHPFPPDVQADLVSAARPNGHVTNSDLEHAALIAQTDVMAHSHDVRYATLENFSDNTPAVSRDRKGAVSSIGPAAYLCQIRSDHQRQHRYLHSTTYLPGPANVIADDASRLQSLSHLAFASHLEQHYPLATPWQRRTLRPEMASTLISALRCKPQTPLLSPRLKLPDSPFSRRGSRTASPSVMTLASPPSRTRRPVSATSSSSASESAALGPPTPVDLFALRQWRKPSWPSERASPSWVARIPASKFLEQTGTIPYWLVSSSPSPTRTTPPSAPTRQTSPSSTTSTPRLPPRTRPPAEPSSTPSTSPSWGSSGCSVRRNTSPAPARAVPRPSPWPTSPSKHPSALWLPSTPL